MVEVDPRAQRYRKLAQARQAVDEVIGSLNKEPMGGRNRGVLPHHTEDLRRVRVTLGVMTAELTARGVTARPSLEETIPGEMRDAGREIGELCLDAILAPQPDDSPEVTKRLEILQNEEVRGALVGAFTGLLEKIRMGRGNVAEILGVDPGRINYLQKAGVLPKGDAGQHGEFSLLDVIAAIIAESLVDRGEKVPDAAEVVSPLQIMQGK